jgi:ribosome recycling factor
MTDISHFSTNAEKVLQYLGQQFASMQLGRASSSLVEHLDVYIHSRWSETKLNSVANVLVIDAQTIKIEPRDKSTLKDIEKGIHNAQIGLNPINNGDHLLINVPPMTTERRADLAKFAKKEGEEAKISLRNCRQDMQKIIKSASESKEISDTEKASLEKQIDDITKKYNEKIDDLVTKKSEEIMKI